MNRRSITAAASGCSASINRSLVDGGLSGIAGGFAWFEQGAARSLGCWSCSPSVSKAYEERHQEVTTHARDAGAEY